jgi:tetratricopeptide (TPR) repeat protein
VSALDRIYNEITDNIATPRLSFLLIKILKEEGKPERVTKACLKALEFFPDDIHIRRLLAETYFEQKVTGLAEQELAKLSKQIDDLSFIYKLQAELFRKQDRIKEATNSLKLYLAHHRSDQEAVKLLSELSSPPKEKPSVLPTSTLAEIYYKQGDLEEAIKIYEQVLTSCPGDEKSKIRLSELKEIKETEKHRRATEGILKEKKLRLIGILERWLANIKRGRVAVLSHQS